MTHNSLEDITKYTFQDAQHEASCSFIPEYGATLIELQLFHQGNHFRIFDGFKSAAQVRSNDKSRGIFLIPFPNRVEDGRYVFEGKQYQLPINKPKENNAIHGFIWNKAFQQEEKSNTVTLTHSYQGDYPGFPFPFSVQFEYELTASSLLTRIKVFNTGKTSMPLGIGWHPYFTLNKPIEELQLQLPSCNHLEANERLIPTGNKSAFNQFQTLQNIGDQKFDDAFECVGTENFFETKLRDPQTGVTITLQQDAAFRYLQVYTPSERNSIALEPMTCPANAFNSGEGLITLKSNASFEGKIKIAISG